MLVEIKNNTRETIFETLVLLDRISVILLLVNSTFFDTEKRHQIDKKEVIIAKLYIYNTIKLIHDFQSFL